MFCVNDASSKTIDDKIIPTQCQENYEPNSTTQPFNKELEQVFFFKIYLYARKIDLNILFSCCLMKLYIFLYFSSIT